MNGARARLATRWAVALLLLGGSLVPAVTTQAAPSAAQVAEAKRKLEELNRRLELYVEQYNQAKLALQKVQDRLAETRDARDQAVLDMSAAEKALNRNAARAYQSVGSQLLSLFDATSLNDFSDRLEFIGNIVPNGQGVGDLWAAVTAVRDELGAEGVAARRRAGAAHRGFRGDAVATIEPAVRSPLEGVERFVRVLTAEALQQHLEPARLVVLVLDEEQVRGRTDEHPAVPDLDAGAEIERAQIGLLALLGDGEVLALGEHRALVAHAVTVGVFEDDDFVVRLLAGRDLRVKFSMLRLPPSTRTAGATRQGLLAILDLTRLPLITIDPVDARDHDDAVHAMPDPDPKNAGGHIVTGPVAVAGAEPGDMLEVRYLSMVPRNNYGSNLAANWGYLYKEFGEKERVTIYRIDPATQQAQAHFAYDFPGKYLTPGKITHERDCCREPALRRTDPGSPARSAARRPGTRRSGAV